MTAETLTEVAEALNRRYRRRHGGDLPPLLMLTDEKRLPDPLAALGGLPEGSAVILRHYGLTAGERRTLAAELRAATRKRGILLLIAGDEGLARETEADGVHLPERAVRPDRQMAGRFPLVTAAAHSAAALERAARAGADAALLSPVFPTASHPGAASIGVERAAAWAARAPLPVYALGGVSHETARRLLPHPFAGIAGVGIFAAQMP